MDAEVWDAFKDVPGPGGRTRLMYAACHGLLVRASWLLARGADVNARLPRAGGCTPLMLASQHGHVIMVEWLCKQPGILLDEVCRGPEGDTSTALILACYAGHANVAYVLMEYGADTRVGGALTGYTALMWAIRRDDTFTVGELLECAKVSPHDRCVGGLTALMLAAELGRERIVVDLYEWHAGSLNAVDEAGATALLWACQMGHQKVALYLLDQHGVEVNVTRASDGMTPLLWAAARGWAALVQTLCELGADVNALDAQGRTPLMLAAAAGHAYVLPHLYTHGAHVEVSAQKEGMTALMLAAAQGHVGVVSTLLDSCEADMNAVGGQSMTALLWARVMKRADVEALLVKRGALETKGPFGGVKRGGGGGGGQRV